jgi:hypothetical protein
MTKIAAYAHFTRGCNSSGKVKNGFLLTSVNTNASISPKHAAQIKLICLYFGESDVSANSSVVICWQSTILLVNSGATFKVALGSDKTDSLVVILSYKLTLVYSLCKGAICYQVQHDFYPVLWPRIRLCRPF